MNLFTNHKEYEALAKSVDKANALKRGCYKKKPDVPDIIDPYLEIQNICTYLARFFERPNFPEQEDEVAFLHGFKFTVNVYEPNEYMYDGKLYIGESFKVAQAELDGTQHFSLNERLELHRKVLSYMKEYDTLEAAYNKVKPEIIRLQQNYKKREDDGWRKLLLG